MAGVPILLVLRAPDAPVNKYVVSVAQASFSALFIHLSGGRIETHFHVFGSLAFLAFYRDWRVLVPATAITAVDHVVRGVFWPQSVFGVIAAAPWRAFEHAGWVIFEDIFLVYSCVTSSREAREIAHRQAKLEQVNATIEREVQLRTQELEDSLAALSKEVEQRTRLESQLVQAQKLESIGQLAAGIAHEINTPVQYVSDNTRFLDEEFEKIMQVVDSYAAQLDPNAPAKSWFERAEEISDNLEALDYEFLRSEIPPAIKQSLEGLDRITHIVKAMKDFSHPGSENKESTDLNRAIDSTITVCQNRWKYAADLELDLAEDLPMVPCRVAEFNQVILNLVVNAADAIAERFLDQDQKGRIKVSTRPAGDVVEVHVTDNGGGIPEKARQKIFDPFFTTKEVGKGTGQGLAISRDIIVQKHGGSLDFETRAGEGTTFTITMPIQDTKAIKEAA